MIWGDNIHMPYTDDSPHTNIVFIKERLLSVFSLHFHNFTLPLKRLGQVEKPSHFYYFTGVKLGPLNILTGLPRVI